MIRQTSLSAILVIALLAGPTPVVAGDDDLDLVTWMGRLQYYTHKLGLSIDAGNQALIGYYIHEVEEVIEEIEKVDDYDGVAVGKLTKKVLVPAFETLEEAFESGDQSRLDGDYNRLITACNQCHESSNRFYLVVERRHDNPFAQRFKAVEAPAKPESE
jgi:hypothetical protein